MNAPVFARLCLLSGGQNRAKSDSHRGAIALLHPESKTHRVVSGYIGSAGGYGFDFLEPPIRVLT